MTEVPPGNSITRLQLILTKALQGQATVLTGATALSHILRAALP